MRNAKYIIFNPRSFEYPRNLVLIGNSSFEGEVSPSKDRIQSPIVAQLETAGRLLDRNQVEEAIASLTALREVSGDQLDIQATASLGYMLGLCFKKWALLQEGEASWEQAARVMEEALDLVHATHDVQTYAVVYNDLGFVYQSLAGFKERKDFLAKAQTAFEKARFFLEQWEKNTDPQEDPVDYWLGLYHLGNTHTALGQLTGDEQYYQTAISFYEEVIRHRPSDQFQSVVALAQYGLGFAHHTLAGAANSRMEFEPRADSFIVSSEPHEEEAEEHRNQAKSAYQAALDVFNAEDYPLESSHTQNCLANLYLDFARVHHQEEYLNQVVAASKEVLHILTSKAKYPIGYALILHNLGSACKLYTRYRENEKSYLWKSLYYYEAILKIENLPPAAGVLGSTYLNLGLVYSRMAGFKNPLQNLNNAVSYFERAVKFYSAADDPVQIAIIQTNFGDAYLALSKLNQTPEFVLKSLEVYRDAGKLFQEQHRISDYADNQAKLGAAYLELAAFIPGETEVLHAIECYQAGLAVLDRKTNPEIYERTQAQIDEARRRLEEIQAKKD